MDVLEAFRSIVAVSLPYLSLELTERRFVSLVGERIQWKKHMEIQRVKHKQMPCEVLEQVSPIQGKG